MTSQSKEILHKFNTNTRGTITIMFAFGLLAIFSAIGLAIDAGRGYSAKSSLQNTLDSALLAAAMESLKEDGDYQAAADAFIKNNWKQKYGATAAPVLTITSSGPGNVKGSIKVDMPNYFMGIIGFNKLKVAAGGQVNMGLGEVEITMALDTTGSMKGSKLNSLKDAATLLVDTVMPENGDYDNVQIGLVPFAQYVNVGTQYRDESWIDVPEDTVKKGKYKCWNTYPDKKKTNCKKVNKTCTNDGVSYPCKKTKCDVKKGKPKKKCGTSTSKYKWYGCVGSRNYPKNTTDSGYGDQVPGLQNTWCSSPLTRLTKDRDEVLTKINGMSASGSTYIPSGLAWAWRVLSKTAPFDDGVAYSAMNGGASVRKALVLMTDGENTRSPTYPTHNGGGTAQANNLTAKLCNNIKETGIEIFTVTFEVTDTDIKNLMKSCASNSDSFFDADNGAELSAAFKSIGASLAQLRLSK